jgi:hypothetical protein
MDDVVISILRRELGVASNNVQSIQMLNQQNGWPINSSFSNQELYGFVATLQEDCQLDPSRLHRISYVADDRGQVRTLLTELSCLQCRAVLLEWMFATSACD